MPQSSESCFVNNNLIYKPGFFSVAGSGTAGANAVLPHLGQPLPEVRLAQRRNAWNS